MALVLADMEEAMELAAAMEEATELTRGVMAEGTATVTLALATTSRPQDTGLRRVVLPATVLLLVLAVLPTPEAVAVATAEGLVGLEDMVATEPRRTMIDCPFTPSAPKPVPNPMRTLNPNRKEETENQTGRKISSQNLICRTQSISRIHI